MILRGKFGGSFGVGKLYKNKTVRVAWRNICIPKTEGGLGIRPLFNLNDAFNLKIAWAIFNSPESQVSCKNNFINHHIFSSLWSRTKHKMGNVLENSSW